MTENNPPAQASDCKHTRQATTMLGALTNSGWKCKDCGKLISDNPAPDTVQASDEPMRAASGVLGYALFREGKQVGVAWSKQQADTWIDVQIVPLAPVRFGDAPRATADAERDLRAELINAGALRQYCHNDGSAGFVTAYDFDVTNRFLAMVSK